MPVSKPFGDGLTGKAGSGMWVDRAVTMERPGEQNGIPSMVIIMLIVSEKYRIKRRHLTRQSSCVVA